MIVIVYVCIFFFQCQHQTKGTGAGHGGIGGTSVDISADGGSAFDFISYPKEPGSGGGNGPGGVGGTGGGYFHLEISGDLYLEGKSNMEIANRCI